MSNVEELLQRARPGGESAAGAIGQLLRLGGDALGDVVAAFERQPYDSPGLAEVIRRNRSAAAVAVHLKNLGSESIELSRCSMAAIGSSGDPAAVERLVDVLTDDGEFQTRRAMAASALDAHADDHVLDVLRETIDDQAADISDDDASHDLLIEAVIALSKHGDHSRAPLLLEIASRPGAVAQEEAVQSLEVAVADGMVNTLAAIARSPNPGLAELAASPLFLLGDVRSCDILCAMAEAEDYDVSQTAVSYLWRLLGTQPRDRDELNAARREWSAVTSAMESGVCYRNGRPVSIGDLATEFRQCGDSWLRAELADELQVRTGLDVQGAVLWDEEEALVREVHERGFSEGGLYKWGYRRDIPAD